MPGIKKSKKVDPNILASLIGAAATIIAVIIPLILNNYNKHKPHTSPRTPVVIEKRQVTDTKEDLPVSEKQEKILTLKPDPIVYKAITGTCYHNKDCGYLKGRKIPIRLNEAKALKLKPCKRCKPPG
ncbi:MAG TPA: hypothetical protein VK186_28385 [Candidatus Deferrimicrobium sp.]|nr:hypothetical protein [Candidatus Deferrimicrobium sp.]